MRALGCTYGQGYYFAHPVADTEIAKMDIRAMAGGSPHVRRCLAGAHRAGAPTGSQAPPDRRRHQRRLTRARRRATGEELCRWARLA